MLKTPLILSVGCSIVLAACADSESPPSNQGTGGTGGAGASQQGGGPSSAGQSASGGSAGNATGGTSTVGGHTNGGAGGAPPSEGETVCDKVGSEVTLCDDFNGSSLDLTKWWYGRKHWGPEAPKNHGVAPENVSVHDGRAFFAANGDSYTGAVKGVRKGTGGYVQDQPGLRSGGIIVSDAYLGSGRYEARVKLPPSTGVCSALWTFHYQEIAEGAPEYQEYLKAGNVAQGDKENGYYVVVNHEIDIEIPTALKNEADSNASYSNARYNTWIGETTPEYTDAFVNNGANLSDGAFHILRFDWHTGGSGQEPRVEFYVDDVLKHTTKTHVPTIKGRITLGTWFPEWAGGVAAFDVQYLEIDWFKFTPFAEPNDRNVVESYPGDGMTKCNNKADNDAKKPECKLTP
jgi:beta-glucanase (GH16 family)